MSTTPIALLSLAREISAGNDEHHKRSSVSRAYYAAYHGCRSWCEALPGVASVSGGPEGGVHQKLLNKLQSPAPEVICEATKRKSRLLAARLQVFKVQRVKADYFLDEVNPYSDWAINMINGVEQMLAQMQPVQQVSPSMAPAEFLQQPEASIEPIKSAERVCESAGKPVLKRIK